MKISTSRPFNSEPILARLAALLLLAAPAVQAGPVGGYPHCYLIDSFPYTITAPGVYCLGHKVVDYPLSTSPLIAIKSDNVVLDLNGSTLIGDNSRVKGLVYAVQSSENKNVVVRNGTISGFSVGVSLTHFHGGLTEDSQINHGLKVENLRLYRNKYTAIRVEGNGSEIRDNQVLGTGGATDQGGYLSTFGIYAGGDNLRVLNNDVNDIRPNGTKGSSHGIAIAQPSRAAIAANNRITRADYGIHSLGDPTANWGSYRDNITVDVTTPYTGGTDIGNNN